MNEYRFVEETDENNDTFWYTERHTLLGRWSQVEGSRSNNKGEAYRRYSEFLGKERRVVKKVLEMSYQTL